MFTIIHGSHRHGYHWSVVEQLKDNLEKLGIDVEIIDLSNLSFEYCCGEQICQDDECIYRNDDLLAIFKKCILSAEGVYIVTPTYFNMPPAKLKNFIDRSNALLPILENREDGSFFGVWVSGEADWESIECNRKLLEDYAKIMGWKLLDEISETVLLQKDQDIKKDKIQKIAEIVRSNLM